jgi:hypothetical protein
LRSNIEQIMANIQKNEALNRLRVVLAEQDKTNRWLAEQLGADSRPLWVLPPIKASRLQINYQA